MKEEKASKLVMGFYQSICDWYRHKEQYRVTKKVSNLDLMELTFGEIDRGRRELINALITKPEPKKDVPKSKLKALFCFIRGHDWINLYTLNNADTSGGLWKTSWGCHKCMRCGKEEHWQYER